MVDNKDHVLKTQNNILSSTINGIVFCEKHCKLMKFRITKLRGKRQNSVSAVGAAVAESINFVLDLLWRINIKGRATHGTICVLSHRAKAEGSQHRERALGSLSDGKHHAIFL